MNPMNLIWIIPLSASFGAAAMAIFAGGDTDPPWYDEHDVSGLLEGD